MDFISKFATEEGVHPGAMSKCVRNGESEYGVECLYIGFHGEFCEYGR